ncbi:thiolase domain-containing protein [Salinarchaeum sp. IM2453]|uniref:thiolase domain-containing protein n=1 Tax=Salinarchaeum sp. IM2453 TaxID=2862870 RepID=UPI001C8321CE|nr:thiolase domain-containing protein [Salinarchaeum sp. IM2453]QZA89824.1 thiolase domain-containing protein [Salinarchaeum sp. IM2453]
MENVRIAGVGMTKFGEWSAKRTRELFAQAATEAIQDAELEQKDIDHVFYGNFIGEIAENQGHQGPLVADAAGVDAPATRVESACASGGLAVRHGITQIQSGQADVVLVGGAERMNTLSTSETTDALAAAADAVWESNMGVTFPGAYALMANRYFHEFGGSREDLAHIAVKNHKNAINNDLAHFQREIDINDVLNAPVVSSPFSVYDCSPISDGAAAAVLVSEEYAEKTGIDAPIAITGTGQGGDKYTLTDRETMTWTQAANEASQSAYQEANITSDDIDLIEAHDCFTIAEVLALEALGIYERGEAIGAARRGETTADGELPVNLSGGLKAKGHPVGATGCAQITEMTKLLRGTHVNSPYVDDVEIGVTHNAGGTVASAVVHVLEVKE